MIYKTFRITCSVWIFSILFVSFVYAQRNMPGPFPDRVIMAHGEDAETSVSITWRTDTSISEAFLELQYSPAGPIPKAQSKSYKAETRYFVYEHTAEPSVEVHQHLCVVEQLSPDSRYIYRVGSGDYWSEWFEFSTVAADESKFSFLYFGDPQADIRSQWSRVLRSAYRYNPEAAFMLYAGDLINTAGRDTQWHEWFEAGNFIYASTPQVMTPGNHDYQGLVLDPHWEYAFRMPRNGPEGLKESCFFIDYKNLKLISIDTSVDNELRLEGGTAIKKQQDWLDSVLSTNTKKWVILTTHLPFYSPKESRDNVHIRKNFQPILEKYGVDMVLTGHDHSYGRGMATDNPDKAPSIVYVVSVSGPKMYDAGDKDWMVVKGVYTKLFHEITIDGNELVFKGITANGELFDHFHIVKDKKGKNQIIEKLVNGE
ncbi:MAG: metallophosphoesterase family protein [Cyclobacteriaceae bacterium]|nr:metallophosphoesterase family protein [Cyclobacteriaceae bacterium]